MTTKKYVDDFYKKTKSIHNIMIEKMFSDYVLYKNGKRIGALFENKVLLISTNNLKIIFPNATEEKTFDWGYYKLLHIEYNDDILLLEKAIKTTYDDLYFETEFVFDISNLFKSYRSYSDLIKTKYDLHIIFLHFCYEKGLLKNNPIDKQDRILHMNFLNNDLTENGTKIVRKLYNNWLEYNNKNDEKTSERMVNIKMLEKYYSKIIDSIET